MPSEIKLVQGPRFTTEALLAYLIENGHISPAEKVGTAKSTLVDRGLERFANFHGVDDPTKLIGRPRCGLPDIAMARAAVCKWPMKRVSWAQRIKLTKLSPEDVERGYALALQQWSDVADIQFIRLPDSQYGSANIWSRSGRIDGGSGTLAWSFLPCGFGPNDRAEQLYDADENWNFWFFVSTVCHEVGHAIGIDHLRSGNLMAPFISNITKPQKGDITEAVERYGPAILLPPTSPPPTPVPEPVPTPGPSNHPTEMTLVVNGVNYRYRVSKFIDTSPM